MKAFEKIWHSGKMDAPFPGNPEDPKDFAKLAGHITHSN